MAGASNELKGFGQDEVLWQETVGQAPLPKRGVGQPNALSNVVAAQWCHLDDSNDARTERLLEASDSGVGASQKAAKTSAAFGSTNRRLIFAHRRASPRTTPEKMIATEVSYAMQCVVRLIAPAAKSLWDSEVELITAKFSTVPLSVTRAPPPSTRCGVARA